MKGEFRFFVAALRLLMISEGRPTRNDASGGRKRRQDRQRKLVFGFLWTGVPRHRQSPAPNLPQKDGTRTIDNGAASARTTEVRRVASDCSEVRSEGHVRHTSSSCGADQRHRRQGPCARRGAC